MAKIKITGGTLNVHVLGAGILTDDDHRDPTPVVIFFEPWGTRYVFVNGELKNLGPLDPEDDWSSEMGSGPQQN